MLHTARKDRHRISAFDRTPEVSKHPGAIAKRGADECPREEPADEQTPEIWRESTEEVEREVEQKCAIEDPSSSVELFRPPLLVSVPTISDSYARVFRTSDSGAKIRGPAQ